MMEEQASYSEVLSVDNNYDPENQTTQHNNLWKLTKDVFNQFPTDFNYKKMGCYLQPLTRCDRRHEENFQRHHKLKKRYHLENCHTLASKRAVSLSARVE